MRKLVQQLTNLFGYRIERIRSALPGQNFSVIDFVLHVLNQRNGGEVTFVQLGANDGIVEDPCYAWIKSNPWRGVLVEPQPTLAAALRKLHAGNPRIAIEEALVSNKTGTETLWVVDGVPELSGIASMKRETMLEQHGHKIADFAARLKPHAIPSLRLAQLVAKHDLVQLDFLQIDVEGFDYEVIKTIDFATMMPLVLSYEHCNLSPADQRACRSTLAAQGYEFASWLGDTVAIQPSLNPIPR